MTASSSVISLANRALLMVGARSQISNLTETSTEANAISVLYQPTYEQLARTAPWGCLRYQQTLTLLAAAEGTPENVDGTNYATPPVPWLYQYAVPSDSLAIRYLLPPFTNNTPTGSVPISTSMIGALSPVAGMGQIPYTIAFSTDISGNPIETILTNQTQAIAVYTVNSANPIIFDSLFEQAFVASLGAYLVPALSLDLALMDRAVRQAESAIALARVRDGNESPVSQNRNAQWMNARMTGGTIGWCGSDIYSPIGWGDYVNMTWP